MRVLLGVAFFLCACCIGAAAQVTPGPVASGPLYLLVPYGEPDNKDQHAAGVTQTLAAGLAAANVNVRTMDSIDHLVAVDTAGQLCVANGAAGLLIAEGRSEQTSHTTMIPMSPVQVARYPAHVELRLDEVDCRGTVVWSAHATADETPTGATVEFANTVANVGSAVDAGFRKAVEQTIDAFEKGPAAAPEPVPSLLPVTAPSARAGVRTFVLVPFEQPNLADPRAADITRSLARKLSERKFDVKTAKPIDRLTAAAGAGELCTQHHAGAILVPEVRLEQTHRTHAELRIDLLDCGGHVAGQGFAIAEAGGSGGRGMINAAEAAMDPALNQALPKAR